METEALARPDGWHLLTTLVPWVVAGVSTLVAWAFATGRFTARAESVHEEIEKLEKRIQGEHSERKRQVESLDVSLGTLQQTVVRHDEKLQTNHKEIAELRQKVFNGGPFAGV